MVWYGPAGFGIARGIEQYRAGLLAPMHAAMGSVATEIDIVACEGTFCGVFGHINFTQVGDMLGEPAPRSLARRAPTLQFSLPLRWRAHRRGLRDVRFARAVCAVGHRSVQRAGGAGWRPETGEQAEGIASMPPLRLLRSAFCSMLFLRTWQHRCSYRRVWRSPSR